MAPELVFVPAPGTGHLVSTLEFAKRLLARHAQLSITVICMNFEFTSNASAYTKSLVASQSRIKLVNLPRVLSPPALAKSLEHFVYVSIESFVPHVRDALRGIVSSPSNVVGVVLDFFCMPLMEAADEFGLPVYMFMTCNLGFLALMLYLHPSRHTRIGAEFEESDPDSVVPGFTRPVPTAVMPFAVLNKHGGYDTFIKLAQRFRDTKGIIVNSFSEMESYSLETLASDEQTPPIYMVGPVLDFSGQPNPNLERAQHEEITGWLDQQPLLSVVFLCFGSLGSFGVPQLREIALGLERSGQRFLWSVRPPQGKTPGEILPEGFLERTSERGMVCGWAPQMDVLSHGAVGGFVSHCGWNSILESVWHGVPIATWPLYAEQQLNAFMMVREFGMAVELSLDYRSEKDALVAADEVDSVVRRLMENGGELRKKVKETSEMAREALTEGGSSFSAVGQFMKDILGG